MKTFEVKLHGTNSLFNLDGKLKKFGFHTTKFVEAEDSRKAEKIAVILSYQNSNLRDTLLNEDVFHPTINLEEIKEVRLKKETVKNGKTYRQSTTCGR